MAKRRRVNSPLALSVLATLYEAPMHPYEIARLLRHRGKDQSIKIRYGSLYTVVQNLENAGLRRGRGHRAGRAPARADRLPAHRRRPRGARRPSAGDHQRAGQGVPGLRGGTVPVGVLGPDDVIGLLIERLRLLDLELAAPVPPCTS